MSMSANLLYECVGRHLDPDIRKMPVYDGVCSRTGISGSVVNYVERRDGDRIKIPTLAKLLWVFSEHQIFSDKKKNNKYTAMRLTSGHVIAVTDQHEIFTNVKFQRIIPNVTVEPSIEVLRRIADEKCIFLAFCKKPSNVLSNGLRWSLGGELEVNGQLSLARDAVLDNTNINLLRSIQLTRLMDKRTAIDTRGLLLIERSDEKQKQLEMLYTKNALTMDGIRALYNASDDEMILAYRFWG